MSHVAFLFLCNIFDLLYVVVPNLSRLIHSVRQQEKILKFSMQTKMKTSSETKELIYLMQIITCI